MTYKWIKKDFNPTDPQLTSKVIEAPENIDTPYNYFRKFITPAMVDLLVLNTNMYSAAKSGKCINTDNKEIEHLLGMFLRMGIAQMAGNRVYWESKTRYDPVANVMSRNRFMSLLGNLYFVDNNRVPEGNNDKLWKIRPWLEMLRQQCLTVTPD